MDFKNYVKMMLEAEKSKDQDEKKSKDQDEDEDEEDQNDEDYDDNEEQDEEQETVKTNENGCTGSEASCKTNEASCNTNNKKCKKEISLKESMKYLAGNSENVILEEEVVLCEDIKNNSVSKYLAKLAKKAEKEAAKYAKKGVPEAARTSKKAASSLKEASNKIYKCEVRYKAGDVFAKKEYKQLCKQYSKELKGLGKTARGLKGLVLTLLAGTLLLATVGTTVTANANADGGITDKIDTAINSFKEGNTKDGFKTLKDIGENNINFVKSVINGEQFEGTDWGTKKKDMEAIRDGWQSAAEKENNLGTKIGRGIRNTAEDAAKGIKDFWRGAVDEPKKAIRGLKQGLSGK